MSHRVIERGLRARINNVVTEFVSGGPLIDESRYWDGVLDGDVDDTLHLLNGALANTDEMDADRIGVHEAAEAPGVAIFWQCVTQE